MTAGVLRTTWSARVATSAAWSPAWRGVRKGAILDIWGSFREERSESTVLAHDRRHVAVERSPISRSPSKSNKHPPERGGSGLRGGGPRRSVCAQGKGTPNVRMATGGPGEPAALDAFRWIVRAYR